MDRRETLKSLLLGSMAAGALVSCKEEVAVKEVLPEATESNYGRTEKELERDAKLMESGPSFTTDELETIAILCDIILPATTSAGSATEAEVPAFIDFIVKDMPYHRIPIKGGLMWLNIESNKRFGKVFKDISKSQQTGIVDDIAYPDKATPEMRPGVTFFNKMRDLTLTGYFTSKMGIKALGYQGNSPNVWDGVPAEVLKDHDVDYDPKWVAKCLDVSKRMDTAKWDDDGNLLT